MAAGFRSYGRVIKNRNMMIIALVFMVGAAGSEGGINQTYFAPHLTNDFQYGALIVGILMTAIGVGNVGGPILFGWLSDRMDRVHVLQTSLALSIVCTLWVAWIGPGEVMLFISLLIYSAVTSSRGTLTQAIVADEVGDQDRDAAFSLYFLLGFISQPFWVLLTGYLMDTRGWGIALSRLSISYVAGIVLLFFIRDFAKGSKAARGGFSRLARTEEPRRRHVYGFLLNVGPLAMTLRCYGQRLRLRGRDDRPASLDRNGFVWPWPGRNGTDDKSQGLLAESAELELSAEWNVQRHARAHRRDLLMVPRSTPHLAFALEEEPGFLDGAVPH